MSDENVETVRAAIEALSRGDWDAALNDTAPDIEFDSTRDLGEWRGVYKGPAQVKKALERFAESWDSIRLDLDEVIDAGDEIVSRHTATFTGRDGIRVTVDGTFLWRFRDGAITHLVTFREFEDALEATGGSG